MKLETILLGVLLEHPCTGYDLKRYLDTTGRFLRSNTQMSQVYRSLAKMEELDWVQHTVQPRPGAQDAKTFRVTPEGSTVFLDWLVGPYRPPSRFQDPDFGVRIAFAGFMTTAQLIDLLDTELSARREQVARYRHRDRQHSVEPAIFFDRELAHDVSEWAHQVGIDAVDAHIASISRLRRDLLDARLPHRSELPVLAAEHLEHSDPTQRTGL